jgi:5'-nucleotidase
MSESEIQILLTNDDGIESPGLWAAAEALSSIGYVWVVAPREQSSGAGRSMPTNSDGRITIRKRKVHGKEWTIYAVGGSPAQAVQHGIWEILPKRPALVVSGINYGSNMGIGITVSGTVGAALEGASNNIPSLAVSLETGKDYHLSHSEEIDFSTSAYFTTYFAQLFRDKGFSSEVKALKIDIPSDATKVTPWEVTRLSRKHFYKLIVQDAPWDEPNRLDYEIRDDLSDFPKDSDVYVVCVKRVVSVTPLSLDLTARVELNEFEAQLRSNEN